MAEGLTKFWGGLFGGPRALVEATKTANVTGVTLSPGLNFFSPDGTRTLYRFPGQSSELDHVDAASAYAAAAYAFVAMRWRAARMREAPLMVTKEDQKDGSDEWLSKHALVPLLEHPNPDYDMGELLFRTSLSVDMDGQALFLKDKNRAGRPGRLTLFRGGEFTIESTTDRLRGKFTLKTSKGDLIVGPDDVVYFHEPDPNDWLHGLSRLEVFLGWLNLAQTTRAAIRDLLQSSAWPSLIVQPDPTWNPTTELFKEYKDNLDAVMNAPRVNGRTKPLVMLGGGSASIVSASVQELVPGELLNRIETIAASVFGVPAIVLQFEVGLQNSPWSQMAQARRMAYEDTAEAMWKGYGDALTQQLLRPMDDDETHFIRFDTSRVTALQADDQVDAQVAASLADIASFNERRTKANLEPVAGDPDADKMPWVIAAERAAEFQKRLDAIAKTSGNDPTAGGKQPPEPDPAAKIDPADARRQIKRDLWAALRADQIQTAEFEWALAATRRLESDREKIAAMLDREFAAKAQPNRERMRRFFRSLKTYLEGESSTQWKHATDPIALHHAERAAATVVADLGFRFDLVKPGIAKFAEDEVGFLIGSVSETTRQAVEKAVTAGLESGAPIREIAQALKDLPAFSRDRAMLVARTEASRVMNGAPTAMLQERQQATGRKFVKTWQNAGDDRVRDEHLDVSEGGVSGESVPVDGTFSNGLDYPSEPNCRCVVTFEEVPA